MKVVATSGISRNAGGVFYAVSSLCKALAEHGVHLSVLGAGNNLGDDDREVWHPVSVFPYKVFGPLSSSFELRRLLARTDGDLVHQHGIWLDDQWATRQWQKKNDKPVVISPHGMLDPWALDNARWKKKVVGKLFANESLKNANCLHALCRAEAEAIRAHGLKNPIAVIPNGIDLPSDFTAENVPVGDRKRLLFLGRLHPKKGIQELLEAWSNRSTMHQSWELLIAGWDDGGYEEDLKGLAGKLGIDDSVSFLGSRFGEEKQNLLRSADAFILPSFSEGLPMSVLEAWSYELPVLMTDFCNLPVGFEFDAALRIEPNAESISMGLESLASLAIEELHAKGRNGSRLVKEKFTWPKIGRDMFQVYEWCLTGENPPACMEFYNG